MRLLISAIDFDRDFCEERDSWQAKQSLIPKYSVMVNLQAQLEQLEGLVLGKTDLNEDQCRTAGQDLIDDEVSVST